jgi:transposase-like protein
MTLENGSKELLHVATKAYAGAGCSEAEGGRQAALGEGIELPEVIKQLEVSEQTYFRWRNQFGGMKAEDVKRLKELEAENARLKRIVADQVLENQALKEIAKGNW